MIRNLDDFGPTKENTRYRENTLSNVKIFYSKRRKINIGFENGKYPLPKKYVSNQYSFNERDTDAS